MRNRHVLISGAGVAGPALAYWLARYGFEPTVVERAPAPRAGGQAVDFRGRAHLSVLERMGILGAIQQCALPPSAVSFVDARGTPVATMAAEIASGDVEILRGDLGRILFDATSDSVEYLFDDTITELKQTSEVVRVTFAHHAPRDFDLVIGADGLHSTVRSLGFGPDSQFVHHLGYYVAIASVDDSTACVARDDLLKDVGGRLYSVAGRTAGATCAGDATRAIFYFASSALEYHRHDIAQQKQLVARTFAGMGWETPRLVAAMQSASDFYFDSISEVRVDRFSSGRVALVGDAAYGGTIGGMGTGLAVVGAYVLAGELAVADGDYATAFACYEDRMRQYASRCQKGARSVGPFMAPRTRTGIAVRNAMLRLAYLLPGKGMMERIAMRRAADITFGDYSALRPTSATTKTGCENGANEQRWAMNVTKDAPG